MSGLLTYTPTVRPVEAERCTTHGERIGEVTHINGQPINDQWLARPFIWHLDETGWPTIYCAPAEGNTATGHVDRPWAEGRGTVVPDG